MDRTGAGLLSAVSRLLTLRGDHLRRPDVWFAAPIRGRIFLCPRRGPDAAGDRPPDVEAVPQSGSGERGHLLGLLWPGLIGMGLSFLSGLAALRLLSAVLERGRWAFFGVYCLVFAVVVFFAAWRGV